jgi:hypothetical protein
MPNKMDLLSLFEHIVGENKEFITENQIESFKKQSKSKSITMLMDDLWTEKYRKKISKFYEDNNIKLKKDSISYVLLGGKQSLERLLRDLKRRKNNNKLQK